MQSNLRPARHLSAGTAVAGLLLLAACGQVTAFETQDALGQSPASTSEVAAKVMSKADPSRERSAREVRGEGATKPLTAEVDVVAALGTDDLVAYEAPSNHTCLAPLGETAVPKSCRLATATSLQVFGAGVEQAVDSSGIRQTVSGPRTWGFAPPMTEVVRFTRDGGQGESYPVYKSKKHSATFFLVDWDMTLSGQVLVEALAQNGSVLGEERSSH